MELTVDFGDKVAISELEEALKKAAEEKGGQCHIESELREKIYALSSMPERTRKVSLRGTIRLPFNGYITPFFKSKKIEMSFEGRELFGSAKLSEEDVTLLIRRLRILRKLGPWGIGLFSATVWIPILGWIMTPCITVDEMDVGFDSIKSKDVKTQIEQICDSYFERVGELLKLSLSGKSCEENRAQGGK